MKKEYKRKGLPSAIYSRMATKEQNKKTGVDAQVATLLFRMKDDSHHLWDDESGIYTDVGYSGLELARPELVRLEEDARAGRFNILYVLEPNRLTRSPVFLVLIIHRLEKLGVEVMWGSSSAMNDVVPSILHAAFEMADQHARSLRARRDVNNSLWL